MVCILSQSQSTHPSKLKHFLAYRNCSQHDNNPLRFPCT
nr:MAG TPA: hypothetical protein [Bacteriophage sp.]